MLDTDVMVDVLRGFPPALAWLEAASQEDLVLPGYVVMEPVQGCRDRSEQEVLLSVYDVLGRRVALLVDRPQEAGRHTVVFEAGGLPSGTYLVRLEAEGFQPGAAGDAAEVGGR